MGMGPGTEQGAGTGTGSMGSDISCRNVHTGPTRGPVPGPIVRYSSFSQLIQSCQKWQYYHQRI